MNQSANWFLRWVKSPTGPKTTHFWAPLMNWFFPIQALYDWNRAPEIISKDMQMVLVLYSSLFMRWSMRIKPKSYILFSMHSFNVCLQGRLLFKRLAWEYNNPEKAAEQREFAIKQRQALKEQSSQK